MTEESLKKIFEFLSIANNLKWEMRYAGRPDAKSDSVAAHSWRLALMAFLITDELKLNINKEKAIKLALIHDIVESIAGDACYVDVTLGKITKEQKQAQEKEAIEQIKLSLPENHGTEIYNLWQEYENQTTPEGKFIKALDKIEGLTHLIEQGHKCYNYPEMIPNYADPHVKKYPELTPILKLIKEKLKEEFIKGNIEWKEEYN